MSQNPIKKIVILGGGTAGWMTAAALAHNLRNLACDIKLIESDAIGTVGVGEATLPHIRFFNETLGIDEKVFMRETGATFKLGIDFQNWGEKNQRYIHPFGDFGQPINDVAFHHYWTKQRLLGTKTPIDAFSLPVNVAKQNKFIFPTNDARSLHSSFSYAYHLDATLYSKFLRKYSEAAGVSRVEGKVESVTFSDNGNIQSLVLASGEEIHGDLFVDCSGFRALLIEKTLKTGFDDWSHWLPCDRAVAVASESVAPLLPYTKAIAQEAGWQWRIPLQHRTGNGKVYASKFLSDDEAASDLLKGLGLKSSTQVNFIQFTAGKRKKSFVKNCVAIGLSGGFLEPLESTSLYLVQIAIMKLIELWPDTDFDQPVIEEFNRAVDMEYWRIRDFLILHYHATNRLDTPFWDYCKNMSIPPELSYKMNLFKDRGYVVQYEGGLFLEPSWVAVYVGQGIIPRHYDRRVDHYSQQGIEKTLKEMEQMIGKATSHMPSHSDLLRDYLGSEKASTASNTARMSLYGAAR